MWNHTNQSVTPVVAVECYLLSRSIFQRTVGSEMDECIAIFYFKGPGQNALTASGMEVVPSLYNLLVRYL